MGGCPPLPKLKPLVPLAAQNITMSGSTVIIVSGKNITEIMAGTNLSQAVAVKNMTTGIETIQNMTAAGLAGKGRRLNHEAPLGLDPLPDFIWDKSAKEMRWLLQV